jgi:alpha/beta superfamily hydrolase
MNIPIWVKPALYGAVAGAVVLAIVGFSWGGWITSTQAAKDGAAQSSAAVATALTPYCLALSKSDPAAAEVHAQIKAASSYDRRGIIEKAGWATPMGGDKPNSDVARACELAISKAV